MLRDPINLVKSAVILTKWSDMRANFLKEIA